MGLEGGLSNKMIFMLFVNFSLRQTSRYGWKNWKIASLTVLFLFMHSPEGNIHPFCSASSISFSLSIKELMIPVIVYPLPAILPCICTVFKDTFVYVFAIKKKMLLKKRVCHL